MEQVNLPDFIKAMVLLTALPSSWEAPIIQTVMQGGTITAITFNSTKQTILRYWDAEKAKKVGKSNAFTAAKMSPPRPGTNWADWSDAMGREMYLRRALERLNFEYPSDDAS